MTTRELKCRGIRFGETFRAVEILIHLKQYEI